MLQRKFTPAETVAYAFGLLGAEHSVAIRVAVCEHDYEIFIEAAWELMRYGGAASTPRYCRELFRLVGQSHEYDCLKEEFKPAYDALAAAVIEAVNLLAPVDARTLKPIDEILGSFSEAA